MLYERQMAMGRTAAAERLAEQYPWVKHEDAGTPPDVFIDLWEWFSELHITRNVGFAPCAITYLEIQAFSQMRDVELHAADVALIRSIDNIYLQARAKEEK